MSLQRNQEFVLADGDGRQLGRVRVREVRENLILGDFSTLGGFDRVAGVFAEFVEAANEQCLSVIADLDRQIANLRLHLVAIDGSRPPDIIDVQIGDGSINFRVRETATATILTPPTLAFEQSGQQSLP